MASAAVERPTTPIRLAYFALIALVLSLFSVTYGNAAATKPAQGFAQFVSGLWPLAEAQGVSRKTFDAAFKGVTFNPAVVANTKKQAEFTRPVWQYLASAVSASRVERGRSKADDQDNWIAKAETEFGVPKSIIVGIWGMETEYGAFAGSDNVIRSLASLAYVRYRDDYFRDELIAALVILEAGDIEPKRMVGSWAGAMGQTQFMPSSFQEYAVDFDGRGKRDIWNNSADAIGSTANYLAKHGWKRGLPWGFEVRLPENFELSADDSASLAPFGDFSRRGVRRADGRALPSSGEAQLLMPAGLKGPIFLITSNFKVIKSYNNSTSYALGVALLGDAICGEPGLKASWPTRDHVLTIAEARQMQLALKKIGYDVGVIDGQVGEKMRAAIRAYQEKSGAAPDGYPTLAMLRALNGKH